MQWYHAKDGQQAGPVSDEEFQQLITSGQIESDTLVWHEGMENWQRYGELAGTPAPAQAAPEPGEAELSEQPPTKSRLTMAKREAPVRKLTCSECGREFPFEEMIHHGSATICAECKPTFFQRVQEGAELPGFMDYGGFWIRFAAKFIDGLVLGAVNMVVSFIGGAAAVAAATASNTPEAIIGIQVILMVLQLLAGVAYNTFFVGKFAATPGKMACKLRIVRPDGERVTYRRALGRYFAEMLSQLTMSIGYIMAAFDEEKRTLHDRICDTRVIRT